MTTKEIAESVGQTQRSIQLWAKSISEKISSISEKISLSSPMKPADFDISETCLIIEEGLGKAAADVFRTNAVNADIKKEPKLSKLPTGIQMNALIKMADKGLISVQQFQIMVGAPHVSKMNPDAHNQTQISDILQLPSGKLTKQAYAVEMKAREKIESKKLAASKNGDLFKG